MESYKKFLKNKRTQQLSLAISRKLLKKKLGKIPEGCKVKYYKKKIELRF